MLGAMTLLPLASAGLEFGLEHDSLRKARHDRTQLLSIESEVERRQAADTSRHATFDGQLPKQTSADAFIAALRRAVAAQNGLLVTVMAAQAESAERAIPRIAITATTRGNYSAMKTAWSETLSRFPNAVVDHVLWRRTGTTAETESTWELSLLSQPAPVAGMAKPG